MRPFFLLLTVICLATGCSNQKAKTDSAKPEEAKSDAKSVSESKSDSAKSESVKADEKTETPKADEMPLVIDVRTQAEWDEGHLKEAMHIPLAEITDRIAEVAASKDQKIYLHCRSGGRSGQAKVELEGLGYTNVENVGGLEDARAKFDAPQE